MQAVRVTISGRVQGVWFRNWTTEQAKRLGLDGWVRNRHDGTVEAVFKGEGESVREMVRLCHEGPPQAQVEAVEEHEHDEPVADGFHEAQDA